MWNGTSGLISSEKQPVHACQNQVMKQHALSRQWVGTNRGFALKPHHWSETNTNAYAASDG